MSSQPSVYCINGVKGSNNYQANFYTCQHFVGDIFFAILSRAFHRSPGLVDIWIPWIKFPIFISIGCSFYGWMADHSQAPKSLDLRDSAFSWLEEYFGAFCLS